MNATAPTGPTIINRIDRVERPIIDAASTLPTSTLHEAGGRIGALPCTIKPIAPGMKLCGSALTVHSPGGDNLWLHRALYVAQPGDVLVVYVNEAFDYGYWGEIMSVAAQARGLSGLVIDGCVRDGDSLPTLGFAIAAHGFCMRGTGKDYEALGWINFPLLVGSTIVHPGDLIVGDADGIVSIPREMAAEIVEASFAREARETDIMQRLRQGERTLDIYDF